MITKLSHFLTTAGKYLLVNLQAFLRRLKFRISGIWGSLPNFPKVYHLISVKVYHPGGAVDDGELG